MKDKFNKQNEPILKNFHQLQNDHFRSGDYWLVVGNFFYLLNIPNIVNVQVSEWEYNFFLGINSLSK